MKKNLPKLIVILGQTATGKTELAIKLAKKFNGEIISADSRQIYKELNIGASKPTKKEQKTISHHLIDIVNPKENFNVALYKKLAIKKIKEITKKGKLPFLAGGTGFYIDAVTKNIDFPKVKPNKRLRKELERKTVKQLFSIYKKLDPEGSKLIEKDNKRRLIRAIEVSKTTKEPFWKQRKTKEELFEVLEIGIKKTNLEKRIKERTDKMVKKGLEKEAKRILKKYNSLPTIGYQEWQEYFDKKITKEKVKELITLHTSQYAKKQMTWFKRNKKIHWIKNQKQAEKLIKEFIK